MRRFTAMGRPRLLSGPFLRVTLANFFFFLNFASFFLLPLRVQALGGDAATVGEVMGAASLAGLIVIPFIAGTIDRYGSRRFLLFGCATSALASMVYILVDEIGPLLFALRVIQGVGFAAGFTASTTLAATFAPAARRAEALGIFGVSTLITHAIAPAVGEEIIRRSGFPALFACVSLLAAVGLALAATVPVGAEPDRLPRGAGHTRRITRIQWVVVCTTMFCGLAFGGVITFIPTFVAGAGLGRVGTFFGAYTGAAVTSRIVGGGLSDSLGRRAVVLPMFILLACSILLLAFVHSVAMLTTAGILFGLAHGMSYPALNALAVDLSSSEYLGRMQAFFNGAFNLGVTSSAFAFGAVIERWGYSTMFMLAAMTPLAAWGVFYHGTRRMTPAVGPAAGAPKDAT